MNTDITQEQIEAYQAEGCLVLPDFLTPGELQELRAAVTSGVEHMGTRKIADQDHRVDPTTEQTRPFLQRLNLWKINGTIAKLLLDPDLGRMLCRLADVEGLRLYLDHTLQKQPWAIPTAWHTDNPKWAFYSRNAISIWIALDDATLQNGCMYYLPGSHNITDYKRNADTNDHIATMFELYLELKNYEARPAQMKAGSAGVHNGMTAHAAGPNMTPTWRRAMIGAYMPDGATFNGQQSILSDDQTAGLKIGDVIAQEQHQPLVWPKRG
jgi:phytanoyl-CoA hydroxylase